MKIPLNKSGIFAITMLSLLLFSIALPMMTVSAHTPPWTLTSYPFLACSPNPIGLGQKEYFMMWLAMPIPSAAGDTGDRWHPYNLDITKPDGTHVKLGPYVGSGPGLTGAQYIPDIVGTYSVNFSFPGQTVQLAGYTNINSTAGPTFLTYVNDTWLPASVVQTFVVQSEPLQWMAQVPEPKSYWTRPINDNNFLNWVDLASSWLGSNLQGASYWKSQPYGYAPQTAHVMWTLPVTWGGVVGGDNAINNYAGGYKSPYGGNQMTFYSGTQYQLQVSSPIIMYQTLFVSLPGTAVASSTNQGIAAISLITGKTLWTRPDISSISMGQFYDFDSVNQHGTAGAYLWRSGTAIGTGIVNPTATQVNYLQGTYAPGTISNAQLGNSINSTAAVNAPGSLLAIDPMTGANMFNETGVPTGSLINGIFGTAVYGPMGEWLRYGLAGRISSTSPYTTIWQWNNTNLPGNEVKGGITSWGPQTGGYLNGGSNWNMSASYDFNVTLSTPLNNGPVNVYAQQGNISYSPQIVHVWPGDIAYGQSSNLQLLGTTEAYFGTPDQYELWAINLNASKGLVGQVLWDRLYSSQGGNSTYLIGPVDGQARVFTMYVRETQTFYGFDLDTGNPLWGPSQGEDPFNYFTGVTALTWPGAVGYGTLYNAGHSGIVYAFNMRTGQTTFVYGSNATDPFNSTRTIETAYGGYPTQIAATSDNTLYAFAEEHSIDAPAYRGGRIRAINALTGQELWKMIGMAPYQSAAVADGYLVFYNLMDGQEYAIGPGPSATTVSVPGAGITVGSPVEITGTVTDQSPNIKLKGTAAIADADQGPWMDYMVSQVITKPNATGVPVTLTVFDSNNHQAAQVQVTSDSNGLYHLAWTPTTAGEYTIYASFDGSQSYGPSTAETATVVAAAPTPASTPATTPTPTTSPVPATATPTPTPSPAINPGGGGNTALYVGIAAAVIIAVAVAAAVVLRRRK